MHGTLAFQSFVMISTSKFLARPGWRDLRACGHVCRLCLRLPQDPHRVPGLCDALGGALCTGQRAPEAEQMGTSAQGKCLGPAATGLTPCPATPCPRAAPLLALLVALAPPIPEHHAADILPPLHCCLTFPFCLSTFCARMFHLC